MNRRRTLKLLGFGSLIAGLPALPAHGRLVSSRERSEAITLRRLRALVRDPPCASVVGRAYLSAYPERNVWRLLVSDAGLTRLTEPTGGGVRSICRSLDGLRTQDFVDGNTVTLDGWILARSEVSLCALLALAEAGAAAEPDVAA